MITVYAYICGDILHEGHILHLENARALGDRLIVGVLTDKAVMEKKEKPAIKFRERVRIVKSLRCVDAVVTQLTYSPLENLENIMPDVLAESTSHSKPAIAAAMKTMLNWGGEVIILPYYPEQSSSSIKNRISKRRRPAQAASPEWNKQKTPASAGGVTRVKKHASP